MPIVEVNRNNLQRMMKNQSNGEVCKKQLDRMKKDVEKLQQKIQFLENRPKRRYTLPRVPRLKICQKYAKELENEIERLKMKLNGISPVKGINVKPPKNEIKFNSPKKAASPKMSPPPPPRQKRIRKPVIRYGFE